MWLIVVLSVFTTLIPNATGSSDVLSCAPASGSFTIRTSRDMLDVNSCSIFIGNLLIEPDDLENIILDGITKITGKMQAINSDKSKGLRSISSHTLISVTELDIRDLSQLYSLYLPSISTLSTLRLHQLPMLEQCTCASKSISPATQTVVISHTGLKSLDWLVWPAASNLTVISNPNLETFFIPGTVIEKGSMYTIAYNQALQKVNVSNLTAINGNLSINYAPFVNDLHFEQLQSLTGQMTLIGNFTNVTMPKLADVDGHVEINSTQYIGPLCEKLSTPRNICNTSNPISSPAIPALQKNSTQSPVPDRYPNEPIGAATVAAIVVPPLLTFPMVLGVLVFTFHYLARRKKAKDRTAAAVVADESSSNSVSSDGTLKELPCPSRHLELPNGNELQELPHDFLRECGGESVQELDANGWNAIRGSLYEGEYAGRRNSV
ncbi:hypothetical protein GQ44DRAFT_777498 [Phaeosphaeriaceae sp. PMI808]|nr:hypothetical protein GQ44DRAFT_777498 [Phaeosphaeriaceae sp. PMI808]